MEEVQTNWIAMEVFMNKSYEAKYNKGEIIHPGVYVDPTNIEKFSLHMANFIYASYCSNRTSFYCGGINSRGRSFAELRAYGRGIQSTSKYDEWIDPKDEKGEHHMNISRDTVQIMPKFRDRIKGKFNEVDFEFNLQAIDPEARKEREIKKSKFKLSLRPQMQDLIAATGVRPSGQDETVQVTSDQDVDLLFALGGQRLSYEVLMSAAVSSTENESKWNGELKDRLIDDLIDLYCFAFYTYTEEKTGKVKAKYVDPERLIIQQTKHNDHTNASYGGFIEDYSIQRLRMETDLDERELGQIAKSYAKYPPNKHFNGRIITSNNDSFKSAYSKESQEQPYDQMTVQVLNICYIAAEAEKYIYGRHKNGSVIYDKVDLDAKLDKRDRSRGKVFKENTVQNVYTAKWVVGTNTVFDAKKEYGVVRKGTPGFKEALLPLHVYCNDGPSMVERCIGFLDEIQIATLKKRNSLAKMPPGPRMVIDISKLHDTVKIGNKEYSALDLVRAFPKEGILIVKSKGEFDYLQQGASNGRPIDYMTTGLVEDLQIFLNEIQTNIANIKMVTGIEDAIDVSQNPDILVGVMKGAQVQTNTSLSPLFNSYKIMNKNAYQYWMLKWQSVLVNGDIDVTYTPLGSTTIESVTLLKELTYYEFGLAVELMPTNEEKMLLMQYLIHQRDSNMIDAHHVFMIEAMIRTGRIKLAKLYISKAIQEKRAQAQQDELERIEANGRANSQPILLADQAKVEAINVEYQKKMELAELEAKLNNWLQEEEFKRQQAARGMEIGLEAGMNDIAA